MSRLIDADKLLDIIDVMIIGHKSASDVYDVVDSMPTVDAEPVVRCKDCKWYEIAELKRDGTDDKRYKPSVCVIGRYAKRRKADWYCAYGERREDD